MIESCYTRQYKEVAYCRFFMNFGRLLVDYHIFYLAARLLKADAGYTVVFSSSSWKLLFLLLAKAAIMMMHSQKSDKLKLNRIN